MLQKGDRGDQVKALQERLVALGFMTAEEMASGPGIFGPRTEKAVKRFKQTQVNAIADDATLAQLGLAPVDPAPREAAVVNAVIDISHHQEDPDFDLIRASQIVGVIHKATQGVGYLDPTFVARRAAAREAGLLWGAYHFGTGSDPVAQADGFLAAASDGQTLLALDYEDNPHGTVMSLQQAEIFVARIEEKTGVTPGFYSGNKIKSELGTAHNDTLSRCWFWLAQYGSQADVPANWSQWTLWQYTDGVIGPEPHTVPSLGGCDRDKFNGDLDELKIFWNQQLA